MTDQVTLLVTLRAKPEHKERVFAELEALVGPTRSEPGCVGYDLHRGADDDTRFMFYETWRDPAALALHGQMPYLVRWNAINQDLLAAPPELSLWRKHP